MGTLNVFKCIWLALACEIIYRLISCLRHTKNIKDSREILDAQVEAEIEKEKAELENSNRVKRFFHRRCGRGLAGLSAEFKSMCGRKEEKENNTVAHDDPLVKDGLTREDKIVNGGNVKVSSYYDKDGKMVFQRETILPPPTVNDIRDKSQGTNNPSFFIRPHDTTSAKDVKNVEDHIDKTFGKIYGVGKELGDSQKTFVDEHINKTFKDIYDMVLPSVF